MRQGSQEPGEPGARGARGARSTVQRPVTTIHRPQHRMSTLQCINAQHVKKSFNHPTDLMDTLKLLIQGVEHRGNAQINEAHDFLINKF